jgi:hypothetical protein
MFDLIAFVGATINVVDDYYTPGGKVTNGFEIQTPTAVHEGSAALSSSTVDGDVFTGAKGARRPRWRRESQARSLAHPELISLFRIRRRQGRVHTPHPARGRGPCAALLLPLLCCGNQLPPSPYTPFIIHRQRQGR